MVMIVDEAKADAVLSGLERDGEQATLIGSVVAGPSQTVEIV
jgi:hydrogenase maturation factor